MVFVDGVVLVVERIFFWYSVVVRVRFGFV